MKDPTIPRTISVMRLFCGSPRQQLVAHAVNGLPLLVHHVVVFEEVFTSGEVLRLDRLLRGRNAAGNQLRLDRHILFHAKPKHQALDALAAENTEQVVLQRKEKPRCARVALAARATTQLVVDTPGFVPFRTDDAQAARALRLRRARGPSAVLISASKLLPLLCAASYPGSRPCPPCFVVRQEFRIAAEQNVGTAAGHVGGDSDGSLCGRLGRRSMLHARDSLRSGLHAARPFCRESWTSTSDFSTEMVPTRTGWPLSFSSLMNLAAFRNFSSSVR